MLACRFSCRSIAPTGWADGLPTAGLQASAGSGQGIVEYGLILSLMVVVAGVILVVFGGTLAEVLSVIGSAIDGAS
jgi:Flp pilus assembly pilin Flp